MNQVQCRYLQVHERLSDPEIFEEGLRALPWPERKEKVMRFKREEDRRRCLGAGLLLLGALQSNGVEDMTLGYKEQEKPYLKYHEGLCFNLSHGGDYAVCAVSGVEVGVDVEKLQTNHGTIVRRCFHENEQRWIAEQPDRDDAFTRLWTRKESYLKFLGSGLNTPLSSFSAVPGTEAELGVHFAELAVKGHRICVCAPEGSEVIFAEWNGV